MAKQKKKYPGTDFNFGYNVKPKKPGKGKKTGAKGGKHGGNKWAAYVGQGR
jgi:hypothetical protein